MKKTLTVNLGGTVYHIDDDAYRCLLYTSPSPRDRG